MRQQAPTCENLEQEELEEERLLFEKLSFYASMPSVGKRVREV